MRAPASHSIAPREAFQSLRPPCALDAKSRLGTDGETRGSDVLAAADANSVTSFVDPGERAPDRRDFLAEESTLASQRVGAFEFDRLLLPVAIHRFGEIRADPELATLELGKLGLEAGLRSGGKIGQGQLPG